MAISMVSKADAVPKERLGKNGLPIPGLDYIKASKQGDIDPQGFIAIVDKNDKLRAHFHDVDQFQILFGAPGSFYQRTPVSDVMIHYADAFVTYGPLIAGDEPFHYFTLRARPSTGMWFMPEERDNLKYRGRRRLEVFPDAYDADHPLSADEVQSKVVLEDQADGLEARVVTAGPNAVIPIDPSKSPNGQYAVVINGSVECDDKWYEAESIGWQAQQDGVSQFRAGPDGCRVVIVRFPSPASTVSHDL